LAIFHFDGATRLWPLIPISSSAVQKSIASALSGATVANTVLGRPQSSDAALSFYRSNLHPPALRNGRREERPPVLAAARGRQWASGVATGASAR
jgi:hypothetical protein